MAVCENYLHGAFDNIFRRPLGESNGFEFYIPSLANWNSSAGTITVKWDDTCAYAGDFSVRVGMPHATAYRLIEKAAAAIPPHLPGVIIHVEGGNLTRKMYARLGFEPTNIPGIMTARLDTINRHLDRWRNCARKKEPVR